MRLDVLAQVLDEGVKHVLAGDSVMVGVNIGSQLHRVDVRPHDGLVSVQVTSGHLWAAGHIRQGPVELVRSCICTWCSTQRKLEMAA